MASTTVQKGNGLFSNPLFIRSLGWANLWVMFAFLFNNFATFWAGLPGASMSNGIVGILQLLLYPAAVILAVMWTMKRADTTLRTDSKRISDMNAFFIRAAFWAVVLLGCVDSVIAFIARRGYFRQCCWYRNG